jgi:hypothetical protein
MENALQEPDSPSGLPGLQERKSSGIHWGFVLLILWCTAALTFLLVDLVQSGFAPGGRSL